MAGCAPQGVSLDVAAIEIARHAGNHGALRVSDDEHECVAMPSRFPLIRRDNFETEAPPSVPSANARERHRVDASGRRTEVAPRIEARVVGEDHRRD